MFVLSTSRCTVLCFWKQTSGAVLWRVTVWLCLFVYLGIPGLSLVCSRLQLGEPNRHDWSQQLERQREPCRGHGEDERLGRQARRQWCRGGVEPWYWTELPGGPGHLSSLWTQEDHPLWWGKDVWWVQMCVSTSCNMFFLIGENWRHCLFAFLPTARWQYSYHCHIYCFASYEDWKQGDTASLALSKGNIVYLPAPLKLTS